MRKNEIAVLLTCHNRKDKTLACLDSFHLAEKPDSYSFDIFLVDDGSTDGTAVAINKKHPAVKIIEGDGNLFWAGGMRMAWKIAMENKEYDAFLLLNDDVILYADFINNLLKAEEFSLLANGQTGIYSGATIDCLTKEVTYGGEKIITNHFFVIRTLLTPTVIPQECDLTNANILWISKETVDAIGIFDERYTHGIADFDYSLCAIKKGIPVYLAPNIGGVCEYDHDKNWKSSATPFKERLVFLKSPKGLAYHEYLFYIRRHFPLYLPYSFSALWLKTFFPALWDKFK